MFHSVERCRCKRVDCNQNVTNISAEKIEENRQESVIIIEHDQAKYLTVRCNKEEDVCAPGRERERERERERWVMGMALSRCNYVKLLTYKYDALKISA